MDLELLNAKNSALPIHAVGADAFAPYGRVVTGYDFSDCLRVMEGVPVPAEGNAYVASLPELMATPLASALSAGFYGGMPVELGYCNGNSSKLNALEYHKCSEIDLACTDMVLLLCDVRKIAENTLPSSEVEAFFVPAGTAVELFATTLHFAPCKVADAGFKSVVVLVDGTNSPIERPAPLWPEDELLWMRNKWLIAHAESVPASKGAHVGITGENIEVFY